MAETSAAAIDQAPPGPPACSCPLDGTVRRRSYREVAVRYPRSGCVEQDDLDLERSVLDACMRAAGRAGAAPSLSAIVITNHARRGSSSLRATHCSRWPCDRRPCARRSFRHLFAPPAAAGEEPDVRRRTGLLLDPYFSATKIEWLLLEQPSCARAAEARELSRPPSTPG